jgi:hypothetical protein
MNNLELLQSWVADLNRSLGTDLVFDENQVCTLSFGDNLCISLASSETDEALLVVAGPVLALTMDPVVDERLLKSALKLNFLGAETAGGTLALSAYSGMLVFAHTLRFDGVDAILLKNIVENMAAEIVLLRVALTDGMAGVAT